MQTAGFRARLGGGDNEPAVATPPGHRQPQRVNVRVGSHQQRRIRRLGDHVDERQIEVPCVRVVIDPRIDPVAGQQRIAEPDVPAFRERHRLVVLRQGEHAAADQQIGQRLV